MWASAPTGCIRFNGPCRTPCGAVKDAGPYVHNNRRCIPAVYDDTVCGSMWTSTPTGCIRFNGPCRTPCGAVKDAGPYVHNNRRCIPAVYDDTVCGSMWTSTPTGCVRITDHPIDQTTGGAEGPLALSPQQCEAWIECAAAPLENRCTKPLKKKLKIPTLKVFTQFFFKKIVGSRGKAPVAGRSQRNPPPPVATGETPAPRTA